MRRPVRYVYLLAFIAALNSANLGYDIGVMSGAALYIDEAMELSEVQLELLVGTLNFWAIGGAFAAHYVIDKFGRRLTFTASCFIFVVGILCMASAPSYGVLMMGRAITGVGVGVGLSVDPVYIAEVAPKEHRGALVTWSEISINVGILLGFIAAFTFRDLPTDTAWRTMLACGGIMPLVLLVLTLTVMPESPRWLVGQGREAEAEVVLTRLNHPDADVRALMDEITATVRLESAQQCTWRSVLFPETAGGRYAVCVGIGIAAAQQLLAEESILFYQPRILQQMGLGRDRIFIALILMGVLKTACIVVATYFLDGRGRRPMLLLSVGGMGVALFGIGFFFNVGAQWGAVVSMWAYMMSFSLGIGPVCWLLAAEVFPLRIRAKAMALATVANRVTSTIIASTFLSWADAFGYPGYFYFFAALAAVVLVVLYLYLPETKGKSLEEMAAYFEVIAATRSANRQGAQLAAQGEVPVQGETNATTPATGHDEDSPKQRASLV
ncbi:general substrate transporter [Pelagophyceae sp. CCMP2097]|nr:general substrate transporter [Pelagophyceae sp. CCMP2097]